MEGRVVFVGGRDEEEGCAVGTTLPRDLYFLYFDLTWIFSLAQVHSGCGHRGSPSDTLSHCLLHWCIANHAYQSL